MDQIGGLNDPSALLQAVKTRRVSQQRLDEAVLRGLLASFGSSDQAVLDVLTGPVQAKGRLPFELPSSMQVIERQNPALPDDSERPLYPLGYQWSSGR